MGDAACRLLGMSDEFVSTWKHSWYMVMTMSSSKLQAHLALKGPSHFLEEAFSNILKQFIPFSI